LKSSYWIDDTYLDKKHAKKVFENKEKAVKELMKIRGYSYDAQLQEITDSILKDAKNLAILSINACTSYYNEDSEEYYGHEDSEEDGKKVKKDDKKVKKDDKKTDKEMKKAMEGVKKANKEMVKANNELLKNKFDKAIKHYGQAWKHSQAGMGMVTDFDLHGPTLQEVLEIQGEGYDSLVPNSVAALLNAASDDVEYIYTVQEVLAFTQKAINGGDYDKVVAEFVEYIKYPTGSPLCPVP